MGSYNACAQTLAFSPNGKLIVASGGGSMLLWDSETGTMLSHLGGHSDAITNLAFAPDGHLASHCRDGTFRIWDPKTGACLQTIDITSQIPGEADSDILSDGLPHSDDS